MPVRSFIARMHAKRGRRAPLLFTVEELPPACAIYAHSFFSAGALPLLLAVTDRSTIFRVREGEGLFKSCS